jgi:hypothetical protein
MMVGASGFEPEASCAQGSCKKSILLARLALFYVKVHGLGHNMAILGPILDPSFDPISILPRPCPASVDRIMPRVVIQGRPDAPVAIPHRSTGLDLFGLEPPTMGR